MNILLSRNNNFGDFVVTLGGNRTFGNPTVTGVIGVDRVLGVLVPEIS